MAWYKLFVSVAFQPHPPIMAEGFNFFASNFTLINEINDTTRRYPHPTEAVIYQPEKRPLDT